jgi:transcriptional regulator with XRE-family HTH domain
MRSGTLIQQARRRARMTQSELAGKAGTTQSAIARWERGASRPTAERLEALVEACGLELQLSLTFRDGDELAALRRNLDLTVDERVQRVVQLDRFVKAGRASLASSRSDR